MVGWSGVRRRFEGEVSLASVDSGSSSWVSGFSGSSDSVRSKAVDCLGGVGGMVGVCSSGSW